MAGVTENRVSSETQREKSQEAARRNSESQREKSREAARCRRDQESEMFGQLACQLPLPHWISTHLDKASILRLTISFMRLRSLLRTGDGEMGSGCPLAHSCELLSSLDGFLLLLTQTGQIIFTGENVNQYMGLTQMELMGQNIFHFTHPCDWEELLEALEFGQDADGQKINRRERDFFIRVKCTVTNQGKMVNLRSASWKVRVAKSEIYCPTKRKSTGTQRTSG